MTFTTIQPPSPFLFALSENYWDWAFGFSYIVRKSMSARQNQSILPCFHLSFFCLLLTFISLSLVSFLLAEQQHNLNRHINSINPDAEATPTATGWFCNASTSTALSKLFKKRTLEATSSSLMVKNIIDKYMNICSRYMYRYLRLVCMCLYIYIYIYNNNILCSEVHTPFRTWHSSAVFNYRDYDIRNYSNTIIKYAHSC